MIRSEIPINDKLTRDAASSGVESVASVLEENTQGTIDDWYQRLGAEKLLKGPATSKDARASHLPALFDELIHRLRNPVAFGSTTLISKGASAHGLLRLKQGYAASVLIEESRC